MNTQFAAQVERWPLERLIPHVRNARTHSEEQVAQIAGSIAAFGFVNPVLVGDDGVLVAGHGRVLAARKLGLNEAPVIVLSHLTPTQRRALMIADNQIATNAGWNEEMLSAELAALKDEAFDLELLGFDDADLDRLLATTLEESEDIDDAPEPPTDPISRPGDIWICVEHRVLCGDAAMLSGDRGYADDAARAALAHGARRRARSEEHRTYIDPLYTVPFGGIELPLPGAADDAGIVYENVDAAECVEHGRDQRLRRRRIGEIGEKAAAAGILQVRVRGKSRRLLT
jgi:hypothetical protein